MCRGQLLNALLHDGAGAAVSPVVSSVLQFIDYTRYSLVPTGCSRENWIACCGCPVVSRALYKALRA